MYWLDFQGLRGWGCHVEDSAWAGGSWVEHFQGSPVSTDSLFIAVYFPSLESVSKITSFPSFLSTSPVVLTIRCFRAFRVRGLYTQHEHRYRGGPHKKMHWL